MPVDPLHILIAAMVSWANFVTIDLVFKLPEKGGVSGAREIGRHIEGGGGALHGGYMMGNRELYGTRRHWRLRAPES